MGLGTVSVGGKKTQNRWENKVSLLNAWLHSTQGGLRPEQRASALGAQAAGLRGSSFACAGWDGPSGCPWMLKPDPPEGVARVKMVTANTLASVSVKRREEGRHRGTQKGLLGGEVSAALHDQLPC